MNVETESDLAKVRGCVSRLAHDDERLASRIVTLLRYGSTIGRIACATESLEWDAYRLVTGLRFRREDTPVTALPLLAAAA